MIEEGHGKTDVSCEHGSRWIWWNPPGRLGEWKNVILCSCCDCGDPPKPFKEARS